MTPRTISSRQTFFAKIVTPTLWIGGFGAATAAMWLGLFHGPGNGAPPEVAKLIFLMVLAVGATFFWRLLMPLKRVRIDGTSLYVSNYRTEIGIPLSDIVDVSENRWLNYHPVTIRFRDETAFGREITFMPKLRFFAGWSSHPIVAELRALADSASRP